MQHIFSGLSILSVIDYKNHCFVDNDLFLQKNPFSFFNNPFLIFLNVHLLIRLPTFH